MSRDRKITYRWLPGTSPDGPIVFLNENGYITKYTLPALEAALAAERSATRPPHKCGFAFERDRLSRIKKFEDGIALIKSSNNPNNQE
jgi:hypothetical protein